MHVIWLAKPFDLSVPGTSSNPSITKIPAGPVEGTERARYREARTMEKGRSERRDHEDYGRGDVAPYVRYYTNV